MSKRDVFKLNALAAKKFYWVIGHGKTLEYATDKVPRNTWVVFISRPGHYLNSLGFISSEVFTEGYLRNTELVRNLMLDLVPEDRLPPGIRMIHPTHWIQRLYGPGDKLPATGISLRDTEPDTDLDDLCGITNTASKSPGPKFHGSRLKMSTLLQRNGPGIYFVLACRASSTQSKSNLMATFRKHVECGIQGPNRAPNTSGTINRIEENNRVRSACHMKRSLKGAWKTKAFRTRVRVLTKRKKLK